MIGKLKKLLLGDQAYAKSATDPEERQQLALAALLVEMARADFDESPDEHAEIERVLAEHFGLSETEAADLLLRAAKAMDESVSLFDFTRALHTSLDFQQKQEVIRLLWTIALADSRLDKYEDYLVRKVADLLYVPNSDVVRIKHEVAAL
jgi:uncharacterized tellurite resistance protein B-like protein